MNHFVYWSSSVVAALALAAGSAYIAIGRSSSAGMHRSGPWEVDTSVGSVDAGMYTRARTAIHALMALEKKETLYYIASRDSEGQPLGGDCTYRLDGTDPAARWWSITAYGADHFLIANEANVFSFAKTTVARQPGGGFTIRVSATPQPGNWLPAKHGEPFDLMARLYNPAPEVYDDPGAAALPSIVKEGCQ